MIAIERGHLKGPQTHECNMSLMVCNKVEEEQHCEIDIASRYIKI